MPGSVPRQSLAPTRLPSTQRKPRWLGKTRSKHSGVVSALAQIAIRQHGLNPQAGRLLRSLFDRRSLADYGLTSVAVTEGEVAAVDAEEVVTYIEAWVAARAHRRA